MGRVRLTDEEVERVCSLWTEGCSKVQIAKELNRSVNTIRDVLKRSRKVGRIEPRRVHFVLEEHFVSLLSTTYKVDSAVVEFITTLVSKVGSQQAIEASIRSLLSLWVAQKGRCYYTNAPLRTDESPAQACLLPTVGLGQVFATKIIRNFRGPLSHKAFLRMVDLVSKNFPS